MTTGAWPVPRGGAETKDAHCELSTDVMDKSQGTPNAVARATITTDKDGKQMIGFILPYGVALEAGMGLQDRQGSGEGLSVPHLQHDGLHRDHAV